MSFICPSDESSGVSSEEFGRHDSADLQTHVIFIKTQMQEIAHLTCPLCKDTSLMEQNTTKQSNMPSLRYCVIFQYTQGVDQCGKLAALGRSWLGILICMDNHIQQRFYRYYRCHVQQWKFHTPCLQFMNAISAPSEHNATKCSFEYSFVITCYSPEYLYAHWADNVLMLPGLASRTGAQRLRQARNEAIQRNST